MTPASFTTGDPRAVQAGKKGYAVSVQSPVGQKYFKKKNEDKTMRALNQPQSAHVHR